MTLTLQQRNELFETLLHNGVEPADCALDTEGGALIAHLWTGSFFRVKDSEGYKILWHVRDGSDVDLTDSMGWPDVLDRLGDWAREVRSVADTPDLWAELQEVPDVFTAAEEAESSNAPFTPDEQAEIARRLDQVKQLVRDQFDLTSEQLAALDQRVDEVKAEAKHQGRKTWFYTFYGAVISTVMTDEIPPHVIRTILATVVHGIGHLFGFGGPPPMIST